jgi:sugar phosphate isomerase/epimerase
LFWVYKKWAMAQHLKDVPAKKVVQLVEQSGLRITSIHDGGGALVSGDSTKGYINPALDNFLDAMAYAPECLVFHTPHIEGNPGDDWWEGFSEKIVLSLEKYRKNCPFITIENMPYLDGYSVPLITPEALCTFALENNFWVTFDTTHYAQMETDIVQSALKLRKVIKTIHLSDYRAGRSHVFIGEGDLDLADFCRVIDKEILKIVTLECSLSPMENSPGEDSHNEMVSRMREGRLRLAHLIR